MRDERTMGERAAEMEAKGFLTNHEMYDWVRPYSFCLSEGLLEKHPKLRWSDNAEYHLDGRVKYNGRWVGRWMVETDNRPRLFGSLVGEKEGWRVHPWRAFDAVYLQQLRRRVLAFNSGVLWPRYCRLANALYEMSPDRPETERRCTTRPFESRRQRKGSVATATG
jgi:hypothetical protein